MTRYRSLDGFTQPAGVADRFAAFVRAQAEAEPNLRTTSEATIRRIGTWANTGVNEALYRSANGYAGILYTRFDTTDVSTLHLRTFDTDGRRSPTRQYTRYTVAGENGLLVAHEVNHGDYDDDDVEVPGTPQALAVALGVQPFARGLVTRDPERLGDNPKFWGLVGAEEFASLGRFAIGEEIAVA